MNIVTGGLIEIADYNDIALEINRIFSDNTVDLDWTTSDLILEYTVTRSDLIAGTSIPVDVSGLDLQPWDFLVVSVNDGTGWRTAIKDLDYSVNLSLNPEEISFVVNYTVGTQIRAYRRTTHIFGWGQQASVYPISVGDPVLADEAVLQAYLEANINNLIDKVNIMEARVDGPSELTRINTGQVIFATDKSTIISTVNTDILQADTPWRNEIATIQSNLVTFSRTTPWTNKLTATVRWTWASYNDFRYFFNTGCDLRATLTTSGEPDNQGFVNWTNVINEMGSLILNYSTCSQTGFNGISESIGSYALTEDFQTVFTSDRTGRPVSVNPNEYISEYDDYSEYQSYDNLVVVWKARVLEDQPGSGQISLDIRAELDDTDFTQSFVGTIEFQAGYKTADNVTDNSAVFSITNVIPTVTQLDGFTES